MSGEISKKIENEYAGKRLDSAASALFDITRSAASALIESGALTVNGQARKKNYVTREGDELRCAFPEPRLPDAQPENIPVQIVYEDDRLAVVNKPKGMVVHPAPGNYTGTLVSALLYQMDGRLSTINGVTRPGIVHRIDKDTSGLLIIAKTDAAHVSLARQIKEHSFRREYEGIVVGGLKDDSGVIDKPIGRNPKDRKKMAVTEYNSRPALTEYRVIGRYAGFTHVRFILHTGRTHQIRVHMASIGHPLMGDTLYGGGRTEFEKRREKLLCGQCLHAKLIGFIHPKDGEYMEFESPLPDYFSAILAELEKNTVRD